MGLVFAVTSYDGRIIVSPTSCRELMPDPAAFAQCVRDSFQELLAARPPRLDRRGTGPAGPPEPVVAAKAPRRRSSRSGRRLPTSPPA
jgi:hypothetical protein